MEKEFVFPLERTTAMKLLGNLWTGKISGQILGAILLFIGVMFMGNQDFNLISIIFFVIFVLPLALYFYFRMARKGQQLMRDFCDVVYDTENKILKYRSGFPNTMEPNWQEVEINDNTKNLQVRGNEIGGYHIRLLQKDQDNEPIRLGLWLDLDETVENATELAELIEGKLTIQVDKKKETEEESLD